MGIQKRKMQKRKMRKKKIQKKEDPKKKDAKEEDAKEEDPKKKDAKEKMQKRKIQKRKMQKRKIQKAKTQRQRRQRHTNNHLKGPPKVAKKATVSAARLACKSIGTYSNQIMDQKLFSKCLVIYMEPLQDFESMFCRVQMQASSFNQLIK